MSILKLLEDTFVSCLKRGVIISSFYREYSGYRFIDDNSKKEIKMKKKKKKKNESLKVVQ